MNWWNWARMQPFSPASGTCLAWTYMTWNFRRSSWLRRGGKRSSSSANHLRLNRRLEEGMVVTVEPGFTYPSFSGTGHQDTR